MRERKEKLCFQGRKTEEEKINEKKWKTGAQKRKKIRKTIVTLRKNRKQEKEKMMRKKRQATEREENEVENEKSGWKKNKGRDNPRILSATYCSKRTKAAKNSGNVASHSEM